LPYTIFRLLSISIVGQDAVMRMLKPMLASLILLFAGVLADARAEGPMVRLVSPYAAGGVGDALLRLIAEGLHEAWGRPVIVENKVGASGRVGVEHVKQAPADGSVFLFTPIAPMSVFPHSYANLPYDPEHDFAPITQAAAFDMAVAVGPQVPVTSLGELVAWLRRNPGSATYGTPGAGTLPHLCAVLFGRAAGLELVHVPYKGNPPGLADLGGGHIPLFFTSTPDLVQGHKAGRLRILATSGSDRSPVLPDVPTFAETGYAIRATGWYGLYAPAGTPPDVVADVNRHVVQILATDRVRKRLLDLGLVPTGTTPQEFARIQAESSIFWGAAVRMAGFKADD
jgi:tripartite-type tricarboxylate transporter receptor subunit TctC